MNSLDEVFSLLSKERRRYALYYLHQQDGSVTIEELAETIGDWERDCAEDEISDERFEEVILTLNHNHLPKIESAASIEYDRENERVCITDADREVEILLSIASRLERSPPDIDSLDASNFFNSI